jgi:hypothetical protein
MTSLLKSYYLLSYFILLNILNFDKEGYNTVTDLTILQIWALLLNGRVRISAFPTQRFSFRIHGTEKYKSIATQCLQAERILPRQRILLTVKFPKQPNCWDGIYNRERCSILSPEDLLKGIDLDSQELVNNSQSVSQLPAFGRRRSKDRSEKRHQRVRTHCN